jgi:hypothetical protein
MKAPECDVCQQPFKDPLFWDWHKVEDQLIYCKIWTGGRDKI